MSPPPSFQSLNAHLPVNLFPFFSLPCTLLPLERETNKPNICNRCSQSCRRFSEVQTKPVRPPGLVNSVNHWKLFQRRWMDFSSSILPVLSVAALQPCFSTRIKIKKTLGHSNYPPFYILETRRELGITLGECGGVVAKRSWFSRTCMRIVTGLGTLAPLRRNGLQRPYTGLPPCSQEMPRNCTAGSARVRITIPQSLVLRSRLPELSSSRCQL